MATRKRKPASKPAKKPVAKKSPDALPYSAAERDIFYFCDHGTQCRCAKGEAKCRRIDPMAVLTVLESSTSFQEDCQLVDIPLVDGKPAAGVGEARERVNLLLRKAFKLAALDDSQGVTWHECVNVFRQFSQFLERCKKKADDLRTSLGLAPPISFPRTMSATKPASDSNSTSHACKPSNPQTPQPEPASSSEATQENPSGEISLAT